MVGRETLTIATNDLSPTRPTCVASTGVARSASGTTPGHSGVCVCPGDGCQVSACARGLPGTAAIQTAKIQCLAFILLAPWAHDTTKPRAPPAACDASPFRELHAGRSQAREREGLSLI